jgi:hypothetical protein
VFGLGHGESSCSRQFPVAKWGNKTSKHATYPISARKSRQKASLGVNHALPISAVIRQGIYSVVTLRLLFLGCKMEHGNAAWNISFLFWNTQQLLLLHWDWNRISQLQP